MKRFHGREMALLCSPVLLLVGVGWFLSARHASSDDTSNHGPLRLEFHVEPPTTMEAFRGTDAVMVVELKGQNTRIGPNLKPIIAYGGLGLLKVQTAHGVRSAREDGSAGQWNQWRNVWFSPNRLRTGLNFAHIPRGKLSFGMATSVAPALLVGPASMLPRAQPKPLSSVWAVDPKQIKPFSFKSIPPPAVVLRSVSITSATPGGRYVSGEIVFDLTGQATNAQTPFGFAPTLLVGNRNQLGWGTSMTWNATPETPTRRVREFCLIKLATRLLPNGRIVPQSDQILRLSGRANADNCWPLSFATEPFDCAKVKKGQTFKFKSWPAPVPTR